jgi:cellulose synthase/poly-beta-1,6-N-acetylglucosamine synthase-like glycosyltransferase
MGKVHQESKLKGNPYVSVIMPAYNAEATIAETVSSVLAQTFESFELIIINDGSTDKTAAVVEDTFGRDPRVTLITQENGGVARARNSGISASRCEFIAPIDADDLWHPTYLEKQLATLNQRSDIGFVYAWSRYIDFDGNVTSTPGYVVVDHIVFSRLLYWNIVGNGSAMVFRKSAALEYGGYDPRVSPTEDVMLQLKIASRYSVAVTPEYLVGYRQYTGQVSSDADLMYRSWMRTQELVREECGAVPECAMNWKMGELHFTTATRAYLNGRWREATRLTFLAWNSDPLGTCFQLAAFCKQRVRHLAGRAKRALVPAGAPARRPHFLETRPDEFVPVRKAVLRDRRLEYLRRLDEASHRAQA